MTISREPAAERLLPQMKSEPGEFVAGTYERGFTFATAALLQLPTRPYIVADPNAAGRGVAGHGARRGAPGGGVEHGEAGFANPHPPWPRGGIIMGGMNFMPRNTKYGHLMGDV